MKNGNRVISVGIVDDHKLFAEGIANLLKPIENINVTIIANHGKALLNEIKLKGLPDVILLDIEMPIMSGCETMTELLKISSDAKAIALSMHNEFNYIRKMIECGVSGYLLKNITPEEVIDAIYIVADGGMAYNLDALTVMSKFVKSDKNKLPPECTLCEREIKIVQMTCDEFSANEISDKLCISMSTLESYKRVIKKKMGAKTSIGMVAYALKNKLIN
jgi:DNA-binding NarL/FixJ family response regulator